LRCREGNGCLRCREGNGCLRCREGNGYLRCREGNGCLRCREGNGYLRLEFVDFRNFLRIFSNVTTASNNYTSRQTGSLQQNLALLRHPRDHGPVHSPACPGFRGRPVGSSCYKCTRMWIGYSLHNTLWQPDWPGERSEPRAPASHEYMSLTELSEAVGQIVIITIPPSCGRRRYLLADRQLPSNQPVSRGLIEESCSVEKGSSWN